MKKMKKFLAMLLAMVMVLGMSVTTFAQPSSGNDGKFGTADDRGTITVSGITKEEGDKIVVTAYQIVKANYGNNNESFSGYTALYGEDSVTKTDAVPDNPATDEDESKLAGITVTDEQLAAILKTINTNKNGETEKEGGLVQGTKYVMDASADGTSYSKDVPVGVYLVVITGAETKIYSNVVVSLFYKNVNGGNAIDEGSVIVSEESANAWTKVQDNPTVAKKITNGDQDNTDKGNTVNIGDTVNFEITTNNIPYYGGDYPTFNIVDTLDSTLEFVQNPGCVLKINDGSTDGVGLNITQDGKILRASDNKEMGSYAYNSAANTITFDFVLSQNNGKKVYTLNDYEGKSITITYSAVVKDNAKLSNSANENKVVLNYTHDSKVDGNDGHDDDETFTYTFDIDGQIDGSITQKILAKVGENTVKGERQPLKDAKFTLYNATVSKDGKWTKGTVYNNGKEDANKFNGVITSTDQEDNNLAIKGLKAGTYILQETEAPKGYSLNTHEFQIEIKATLDETTGKLQTWSIKIDGKETATFGLTTDGTEIIRTDKNDTLAIPNTTLTTLPSTGGIGTTIFTLGGCAIMIIAAALYFATRRKSAK